MSDKFTEEGIMNTWSKLTDEEVLVVEFKHYIRDYTAVIAKQNCEIDFEYQVLIPNPNAPGKHQTTYLVANDTYQDNKDLRIRLQDIKKIMVMDLESVWDKIQKLN